MTEVWTTIIGGFVAIVIAYMQYLVRRDINNLAVVTDATHTLVNSNMGVQLRLNAVLSRRVAEMTEDTEDIEAAGLADRLLREHNAKQAAVDAAGLFSEESP